MPRYRQISAELSRQIDKGIYAAGEQLPTEQTLSEQFRVNRHTIREAIRVLKEEGIVFSVRGKGNFVARRKVVYRLSSKVQFSQNILAEKLTPGAELLNAVEEKADTELTEKLALSTTDKVLKLEILRFVNDDPFSVTTSCLPAARFKGLKKRISGSFSLYELLRCYYGVDPVRCESLIEVAFPDASDMQSLQVSSHHPLLVVRSLACDERGTPVEYVVNRTRGDLGCLAIDFQSIGK